MDLPASWNTPDPKAPRGFTVSHRDHLGPSRYSKKTARKNYAICWQRREVGAWSRVEAGWVLNELTDRGWVARSGIHSTPMEAWAHRRR